MKTLGICTTYRSVDALDYEKRALYEQARLHFEQVILIDPRSVCYGFVRNADRPRVVCNGEDMNSLNALIVRSTHDREASTAVLVRALALCGCVISDPVDRFSVGRASKLLTTITRFRRGVGTSSYIAFSRGGSMSLLDMIDRDAAYPLIGKPFAGRKGRGIVRIESRSEAVQYVADEVGDESVEEHPILLQTFIEFSQEYRVLVMDGVALGAVEKRRANGQVAANAAQGGQFIAVEVPKIVAHTLANVDDEGLIGVDVAVDYAGQIHIIETNRAPLWEEFQRATGVDVARFVIDALARRRSA